MMQVNVSIKSNKDSKEQTEMQKIIESQLHEQFSINNNAKTTSFIAFLTALIAAFAGYGYVFYNCKTTNLLNGDEVLFYTTFAMHVVLCILHAVAMELGLGQRTNQFVIDNIRHKAYPNGLNEIFPNKYQPDGKEFCDFIPGVYDVLTKSFFVVSLLLCFVSIFLIEKCCTCLFVISPIFMCINRCLLYRKYKNKENDNKRCKQNT